MAGVDGKPVEGVGFGQCITCGNAVERVGWDDECFACQDTWEEGPDDYECERREQQDAAWEEYQALYTVAFKSDGSLA